MIQLFGKGFGHNASTWNCGTEPPLISSAFASSGEKRQAASRKRNRFIVILPMLCCGQIPEASTATRPRLLQPDGPNAAMAPGLERTVVAVALFPALEVLLYS